MSLRDALKTAVARCAPLETQHATSTENGATGAATAAQPMPARPHGIRLSCATTDATTAQQRAKNDATFAKEKEVESCTRVASELIAERVMKKLIAAAMRACAYWGDTAAQREAMCRDCLETPSELRPDLLRHFERTYD